MKFKILQIIILIGMVVCLFLPMFDVEGVSVTGIEAMYSQELLLFGNIIMIFIVLLTLIHFVYMIKMLFISSKEDSYQNFMNAIVSANSIFGLLLITFLGLISNIVSIVFVALMIISSILRYKFLT
jgi:hypothetical protein